MNYLYVNSKDNESRFVLGVEGKKPLICIGVNPSTATPENPDNTIRIVERFANANGFDSYIMLNLFPQRATNPNDLHFEFDKNLHKQNLEEISKVIKQNRRFT